MQEKTPVEIILHDLSTAIQRLEKMEKFILKVQREWKLGKCSSCGEVIHVIDDYVPSECPLCHKARW